MPKKILFVCKEKFEENIRVKNEVGALSDRGFQVAVLCFGKANGYFMFRNKVAVYVIEETKLVKKLSALAADLPLYTWIISKLIQPVITEFQPDVLHVYNIPMFPAVLKTKKKINFSPLVILDIAENLPEIMKSYYHVNHGLGKWLISLKRWYKLQTWAIKQADKVILVTNEAVGYYQRHYAFDADKAIVIPNVVDSTLLGYEDMDKVKGTAAGRFTIFYFGDTSLRRGTLFAVQAMPEVLQRIPNALLLIVGKSKNEDRMLQKTIEDLGLQDSVFLEGYQPMYKLGSYLSVADVCISPLQRNAHHDTTLANKNFQYMYGEKPQLVSNCTAQASLVTRYECGVVYKDGNKEDYVEKISFLYERPEVREQLGCNGKEAVMKIFNWDRVIDNYVEAIAH